MATERTSSSRDQLNLGAAAIRGRRFEHAVELYRQAAATAAKDPSQADLHADAWREAATALVHLGRWDAAATDVARSRDAAVALDDPRRIARAENLAGVIDYERGRWHEAARRLAAARENAGLADDEQLLIEIESNDAILWTSLGDEERAHDSFRWVLSRLDSFDLDGAEPRLLCNVAIALSWAGRHGEADAVFDRALRTCKQRQDLTTGARIMLHRVRVALRAEDLIQAHSLATRVAAFSEWLPDPVLRADTALLLGSIEARMEHWQAAEDSLRGALDVAADGRAPRCEAEAWAELGELFARQGRTDASIDAWRRARACYRALGANPDPRDGSAPSVAGSGAFS